MKRRTARAVDPVVECAVLEIDGAKYRLAYDFNAIAEAEALGNCNLLHGISATLLNTMTAGQLRGLLFAALQPNYPYRPAKDNRPESGISIQTAGAMIRIDTMPTIIDKIAEAFALSMPRKKENPPVAAGATAGS